MPSSSIRIQSSSLRLLPLLILFILSQITITVLLLPVVNAWVPPLAPDGKSVDPSWETVHTMRARLGLVYNYTPSLLHPEVCRYVSEAECQHADESLQQHAQTHTKHIQQRRELREQQQQQQQKQQQQHEESTRRDLQLNHNPNLGKIKVLILMIRFPDHAKDGRKLISKSTIEEIWKGEVTNWFAVNARGLYEIEPVVIDWITTDKTEAEYTDGKQGFTSELQEAMWPALDQLDNRPDWDWSSFDSDQDGFLDSVVMMHSGVSAVVSTGPDCFGQEAQNRIWPHAWASIIQGWQSKDKSVRLNGYTVNSVYDGDCDEVPLTTGLSKFHDDFIRYNIL